MLLDNVCDAFQDGAFDFCSSVAACLHEVGIQMPRDSDRVPFLDVHIVIDALRTALDGPSSPVLGCPRQAPSLGVVQHTYSQWFQPFSVHRRYCQLPVSGRNMKRFLQFRLGCHKLPVAVGRRSGVARHCRLCACCAAASLGDEKHLVFECATLTGLRAKYADLFRDPTHTMRSFFAQGDHLRVFHYVIECLDFMNS